MKDLGKKPNAADPSSDQAQKDAEWRGYVHPSSWINPVPKKRYDLVVLGAGASGLSAAYTAVSGGASVALIEENFIGGACLNVGCISSKAMIRAAQLYNDMRHAENFGVRDVTSIDPDFSFVMERLRRIRARIAKPVAACDLAERGIDVFFGHATFIDHCSVQAANSILSFKKAIIATGAQPKIPEIPGLIKAGFHTNRTIFELTSRPRSLLVIGGGPLGCELAQAFCRLGSEVIIVQNEPMFLSNMERDAAQILSESLARDGVKIHLNTDIKEVRVDGNDKIVDITTNNYKTSVSVEHILVGVGRIPNIAELNLGAANVKHDAEKGVIIDDRMRTTNENIYAVGEVCGSERFGHIEYAAASAAVRNALFSGREEFSQIIVPGCTYTDPEVAYIGLQVTEARARNIPVKTFTILMHEIDRAIIDGEEEGFLKIHVREGTDKILGATIIARHAGDLMNGISLAMNANLGLGALRKINPSYPTLAIAIKMAAIAYGHTQSTK